MIKFFRIIRKELIAKNQSAREGIVEQVGKAGKPVLSTDRPASRTGRYLKYAIGEILLVVIGILIALSINNWNESRKDRNIESQVLNSILIDLISNEEILQKAELKIDRQISETKLFLELMHKEPIDSTFYKVKKLLYFSSEVEDVQLHLSRIQGAIDNKIELITNDSIKKGIIQYPVFFEGYKEQENLMRDLKNDRIRPRLKDYIFLENIATGSNKFSSDVRGLLSDRTLANDFTDRKWESGEWRADFMKLRKYGQDLIQLIEKELNRK